MFEVCKEILEFFLKRVDLAQWEKDRAEIIAIVAKWMEGILELFRCTDEFSKLFDTIAKNAVEIISARVALLNGRMIISTIADEEIEFLQAQIIDFPSRLQELHGQLAKVFGETTVKARRKTFDLTGL